MGSGESGEGDGSKLESLGWQLTWGLLIFFSELTDDHDDIFVFNAILGCGTAFDFHKTTDYLFLVGEFTIVCKSFN
jgi:hypothetical protein